MTVTDKQVAALRGQLAGPSGKRRRRVHRVDPGAEGKVYPALIAAAFAQAVERRFADASDPGIILFVGELRAGDSKLATRLDPRIAERLIRAALSDEEIADIGTDVSFPLQLTLLRGMIADERLDDQGLDRVMAEARKLADEWLDLNLEDSKLKERPDRGDR